MEQEKLVNLPTDEHWELHGDMAIPDKLWYGDTMGYYGILYQT